MGTICHVFNKANRFLHIFPLGRHHIINGFPHTSIKFFCQGLSGTKNTIKQIKVKCMFKLCQEMSNTTTYFASGTTTDAFFQVNEYNPYIAPTKLRLS